MPPGCRQQLSALLILVVRVLGQTTHHAPPYNTKGVAGGASQCEARTINYITHSLPQLCLTSIPTSVRATVSETASRANDAQNNKRVIDYHDAEDVYESTSSTTTEPEQTGDASGHEPIPTSFMSFEDWKETMLRKTGQDPQALRVRKSDHIAGDDRRKETHVIEHETLGDEGEILLNFEKDSENTDPNVISQISTKDSGLDDREHPDNDGFHEVGPPAVYRSKDAGKTCKERFSYASFDAGATILKAGGGAKNAKAILVENKDSYMLMECATPNKYVIVELSDDIQVDTIVLANFEFFSSMIRHFRLSVSDRYPVKLDKWRELGTFEARNVRDIQPFLVQNPQIWAKYVRIEFLTHFGNEYYCPLSLLRIHGSRLLDSWKDSETGREEDIVNDEDEINTYSVTDSVEFKGMQSVDTSHVGLNSSQVCAAVQQPFGSGLFFASIEMTCNTTYYPQISMDQNLIDYSLHGDPARYSHGGADYANTTITTSIPDISKSDEKEQHVSFLPRHVQTNDSNADVRPISTSSRLPLTNGTKTITGTFNTSSSLTMNRTSTTATTVKSRGTATTSGFVSSPTVQEGFFNAIAKRIQQVESNLTLSLKYVEEQSKHAQDSFHRAEQKQLLRLKSMLSQLNNTVHAELRGVRDQYDQIWQSTVLALESQRDQHERDIIALSSRLNLLADEVVFQKRMAIVQAVLLLSCLFLVIFSRGVTIPYLASFQEHNSTASSFAEILALLQKRDVDSSEPLRGTFYGNSGKSPRPARSSSILSLNSPHRKVAALDEVSCESDRLHGPRSEVREYQGQSPPLTPKQNESGSRVDWLVPRGSLSTAQVRKPLPSLPENPASPDRD